MTQLRQEFYDEDAASSILRRASEVSVQQGISREELTRSAAELGITPEQLAQAEQEILFANQREEQLQKFKDERKQNALKSFGTFLAFAIFAFWFDFRDGDLSWIMLPFVFWGWSALSEMWTAYNPRAAKREFDEANRVTRFMHPTHPVHKSVEEAIAHVRATEGGVQRQSLVREVSRLSGMSLDDAKDAVKAYRKLHPNAHVG